MADHLGPSSSFASIENNEFDVIIIGGGTAGLVVAHRLTEDSNTNVLVIEAGSDRKNDPRVYTPGLMSLLYGDPEVDWDYMTPPQVSQIKFTLLQMVIITNDDELKFSLA